MAPGFFDTVMGACRAAGFEPKGDENAAGKTAWGFIADGRGVALINRPLEKQLPRGILVRPFCPPIALTIDAVWCRSNRPDIPRVLEAARLLASEAQWLVAE
jgi:DNA-binding transcriptional LysR family regulator